MHDRETIVELGFGLFAALLLGALAILLGGRASGRAERGAQYAAAPPASGLVPPERQQARGVVSPQ